MTSLCRYSRAQYRAFVEKRRERVDEHRFGIREKNERIQNTAAAARRRGGERVHGCVPYACVPLFCRAELHLDP